MRWRIPPHNSERVRCRFAFWPILRAGEYRWLEWVYYVDHYYYGQWNPGYFADKEHWLQWRAKKKEEKRRLYENE